VRSNLFDSSILATAQQAVEFVSNILESSTEYSLIGKDLNGKILLWNEGARRMYGYEAEEVVGKLNSEVLHTPEDVATGKPREIMDAALRDAVLPEIDRIKSEKDRRTKTKRRMTNDQDHRRNHAGGEFSR
jgi:PAS domain S-box-containing protein